MELTEMYGSVPTSVNEQLFQEFHIDLHQDGIQSTAFRLTWRGTGSSKVR
jgi:hypothetical protein